MYKYVTILTVIIGIVAFNNVCKITNQNISEGATRTLPFHSIKTKPGQLKSASASVTDYLPSKFVTDGSVDYTNQVQQAINRNRKITFPAFPILINDKGLQIPSNTSIEFLKGSKLILKPSTNKGYSLLTIAKANNITLINPVLIGDRYKHMGTQGEWGMGISIYGGKNITILSPIIKNMWGDGLYISDKNGEISSNIIVKKAFFEYNRRNGISIISVDGLILESPYVAFCNGTLPMAGIEVEPNTNKQEIKNVLINNPYTKRNLGAGVYLDFGNLMGNGDKKVDVKVYNHTDDQSNIGMVIKSREADGTATIKGEVKIVDPAWNRNSMQAVKTALHGLDGIHLTLKNPVIKGVNGITLSKQETINYLMYKRHINKKAWTNIDFSKN
jgi:hypothetical protein